MNLKPGYRRIICLLLFIISISFPCKASYSDTILNKNYPYPEIKIHYGFIIRHHKGMAHLTDHHFPSCELNLIRQTDGSKPWQQIYGLPQTGLCFWYSDLGHSIYLGSSYALVPFINFPVFQNPHFRLNYRFGIGLGWLTKRFDATDDYRNIAIGSNLNAAIKMNFEAEWYFHQFIFSSGLGLTHMSDGAFSFPNLGINIATVNVGAAYQLKTQKYSQNNSFIGAHENASLSSKLKTQNLNKQFPFQRNSYLYIIANIGIKSVSPPESRHYPVYNISGEYLKKTSLKSEFGAGIDLIYDLSEPVTLKHLGDTINQSWKAIKPGIFFAYQLDISKLKLQFNLGRLLYSRYHGEGYFYDRIVLRYPLSERLLVNFSLRSFNFKADATELGLGYRIK